MQGYYVIFLILVRVADVHNGDDVVQVTITVLDVNDNVPIFENLPYSLKIPEVLNNYR